MMYLNERLSTHDTINAQGDDSEELLAVPESTIKAISHIASGAESNNFEIARNLKDGKNRLIHVLCRFPACGLWLLKRYEQNSDCFNHAEFDTEISTVSEAKTALFTIKSCYQALLKKPCDIDCYNELSEALQNFPFCFEDLVELADLIIYSFKRRALSFQLVQNNQTKNTIEKRLISHNKRQTEKLAEQFNSLVIEKGDECFLFLTDTLLQQYLPPLILAENDWLKARKTLVSANSRLVLFIANQYKSNFLDFDDLVQEGQTGLLKAVDRFNPDLGFQFSTYSSYWIRKAISRALSRGERVVRVPCGQMATINRVFRAKDELTLKTGVEPSISELADYINMSRQEINTILSISQTAMSLENFDDEDDISAPIDFLEQNIFTHAFSEMAKSDLNIVLTKAIDVLNPREAKVIACHFGVENGEEMTLQEIGVELNLTRERVRQIQVMALNKMKRHYGEQLVNFL